MVIKYKFLDNMTSEVEVDNKLGKHITEMDEAAAKIDRKETRRHVYIVVKNLGAFSLTFSNLS